jgi:hypothetical protein
MILMKSRRRMAYPTFPDGVNLQHAKPGTK